MSRRLAAAVLTAASCAALAARAAPAADPSPADIAAHPSVSAALAEAGSRIDRFVEEWIRIAEIPAPSGDEGRRAAYLQKRFADLGLQQVGVDAAGNVTGLMPGRNRALPATAILAHMDTVAAAGADHTVRRLPGGRLRGPGVRDDSSGLAALIATVDLMRRHGLTPDADTWFVATAREETGLHGADRFVADHEDRLGAVIAVDGQIGLVSHAATGIVWLKLHFLSQGAHTLVAHDSPSAILAAARTIESISAIPLRRSPEEMESWLSIGMIGGGEVPNAQARDAWFTVDLRSNDPDTLAMLERQTLEIGRRTARQIGVDFDYETLHRMEGATIPGSESSPLTRWAAAVLDHLAVRDVHLTPRGTADHNVALRRGIPGIGIGVTSGDGAHTPTETADIAPFSDGVRQIILLALRPTGGAEATGR